MKHLFEGLLVDAICNAEASVLLLLLGDDIQVCFVDVDEEPKAVDYAVQCQNEWPKEYEKYRVPKSIR